MTPCGFEAYGEDDQIKLLRDHLSSLRLVMDSQIFCLRDFLQMGDTGSDITHAILLFCPFDVLIKILSISPHVHVKDGGFHLWSMFFRDDRFFGSVHTANRGTIPLSDMRVSRADTLNPCYSFRVFLIRRSQDLTFKRTRGRKEPFKFNA